MGYDVLTLIAVRKKILTFKQQAKTNLDNLPTDVRGPDWMKKGFYDILDTIIGRVIEDIDNMILEADK